MRRTVTKPTIKRRDMDAVLRCLVDEAIGPGEHAELLTKEAASYLGLAGGIALREYGRAVEVTVDALGLSQGGRVLVSPLTSATYRWALERRGITPVLYDVDPDTGTISAEALDSAAAGTVQAVVVDSPFGLALDIARYAEFPVPIIEDISYSLGAHRGDSPSGSCGRYVICLLEEDGVITAGGGALVLGRHSRAVGELRCAVDRAAGVPAMGNLNASLASTQLKHIDEFAERRRAIAEHYLRALSPGPHKALGGDDGSSSSFALFPVLISGSVRDAVKYARSKGVMTKPPFENSILNRYDVDASPFPNASALAMRTLLFPLYPVLKREEIERVAKVLATLP